MASKGQKTIEHLKVVGCTLQTSILYRVAHVELPQEEKNSFVWMLWEGKYFNRNVT